MCCFDVFHVAHLAFLLHCGLNIFLLFLLWNHCFRLAQHTCRSLLSQLSFSQCVFLFLITPHLSYSLHHFVVCSTWRSSLIIISPSKLSWLVFFLPFRVCALSSFHHFSFFFNHSSLLIRHPLSLSPLFCSLFSSRSPSLYITICPSSYGGAPEGQSLNECECHMNFSCALFLFT